jgi:hypothetical protein
MVFQEHARKDQIKKTKQEETMKKLWIVLLSVALIAAFAMPVSAADVKFSGSYIAQGYYDNNRTLNKDGGASVSNIWQRLRVQTDFQIQEGLKLTTRFDAMEKIWGAARAPISASTTTTGVVVTVPALGYDSSGNNWEAENLKMEHVYVSANMFGGLLRVGYQQQSVFGTAFADSGDSTYGPRIRYDYTVGPWLFIVLWDKIEGTQYYSAAGPAGNIGNAAYQVDSTAEKYVGAFVYNWSKGNAGLLFYYYLLSNTSGPAVAANAETGYKGQFWVFDPYFKAQIGPVYLEGEIAYWTGKSKKYEGSNPANGDVTRDGISVYLTGTYDFSPMYAGLLFAYVAGDDKGTTDKDEQGPPGGTDFNPCLLLFNYDLGRWNGIVGSQGASYGYAGSGTQLSNAMMAQIFFGIKPVPKLDVKASYTIAQADKDGAATGWQSKNYGSELDLTATYKIYDNLSYMVGFAYLWAGDYFKGTNSAATIDNDYLVTHKLTLTF